jgi:hypothetical protein
MDSSQKGSKEEVAENEVFHIARGSRLDREGMACTVEVPSHTEERNTVYGSIKRRNIEENTQSNR